MCYQLTGPANASIQNICPISFGHNDLHCLPALNGATGSLGNFPQCLTWRNSRAEQSHERTR